MTIEQLLQKIVDDKFEYQINLYKGVLVFVLSYSVAVPLNRSEDGEEPRFFTFNFGSAEVIEYIENNISIILNRKESENGLD